MKTRNMRMVFLISLVAIFIFAFAAGVGAEGGELFHGIDWEMVGNTLIISGEGQLMSQTIAYGDSFEDMKFTEVDITKVLEPFKYQTNKLVITEGITLVGGFEGFINLETVELPDGITKIDVGAFKTCKNLNQINLPDTITDISNNAFENCYALESIVLPKNLKKIRPWTFLNCQSLKDVIIPDGVTSILGEVFSGCSSIESIVIPDSVDALAFDVFNECINLESITVGENNRNYSSDERGVLFNKDKTILFQYPVGNKSESYIIPDGVTAISGKTFSHCKNLTSVIIPDSVKSISGEAFAYCENLISVIIPDGVISIGGGAFYGCSHLTSIIIPKSVTTIDKNVFKYCGNLTIYGYAGTTAETHANENIISFVDISNATPTSATVLVDGKETSFTAYNIGGNNYFKLRDVAMAINGSEKNFNVGWDKENNAIAITKNKAYTPVGGELVVDALAVATKPAVTNSTVYVDGEYELFTAFNIKNNNYFKLRDIGKAFDFGIGWDNTTKTITVDTAVSYTE